MCGIVGYIGKAPVVSYLLSGLKNLEYRGYDSAGIAVDNGNGIHLYKALGKLHNLVEVMEKEKADDHVFRGIGHIRWATHGKPTVENAHPHCSNDGKFVLVHNGIIENYRELREKLQAKGYTFYSETDTETAVHLIEDYYQHTHDLESAVTQAVQELKGAFAFCLMHQDEPDKIIAVRRSAPLILGLGAQGNFVASDVPALVGKADKIIYLEDEELALVTKDKVLVKGFNGVLKFKQAEVLNLAEENISKRGYEHFMLKEIAEQPNVVRQLIDTWKHNAPLKPIQTIALMKNITKMEIIACGTSLHAAKVAKQIIETLCNLPVEVTAASEYIYKRNLTDEQTLSIGISQSGETADTLTALKQARAKGARIVAITNRLTSNIVRLADEVLPLDAGVEVSVAATKSYTAQLTVLLLFALQISDCLGKIAPAESEALKEELACIPQHMDTVLGALEQIKDIAEKYALSKDFIYMARGINCATAEEGALKLKEISYINATAYAAGELKHGPIALLDEQMPIVALLPPCTQTFAKMISNCEEAKARHAKIIAVTSQETQMDGAVFDDVIRLPEIKNELLTPLLYAVPLQLFAYYTALFLGREVDQPRNLAKSVTVE